ncbi:serine/threonine-protein kinase [Hyalangium gracile]|uniref:serine/threonine-protein kinase n=1 Tax=Hyalangium gracile TaxID=394092 RepID=UPI001CCCB517|nr:serine/threonine-protein kinase [Hyalangium gracile]
MRQQGTNAPEQTLKPEEASGETAPGVAARPESAPTQLRARPEEKDPLLGAVVGSFRLVRKLGGGGMGNVYLAEHTVIGSKVAVKFLHEHFATNEALVQRFLAEARAVNLIGHENIVNIFDMSVLPPRRHYLVMEYLEGQSLASLLRRPVPPAVAVPILTQVCDALQAAHAHGVIHRDLKPENIFLVRRDRTPHFVKVLDFGVAKLLDRNVGQAQTSVGTLLGTPEYMAPEQWTGQPVDGRTDLYALGLIAYVMLTGRRPFSGEGLGEQLQAHLRQVPMSPHGVRPEVPAALSDVVMRAIAKRPEDRFQTASELRAALERAMAPSAMPIAATVVRAHPPSLESPRHTPMAMPRVQVTPMAELAARMTPAPVARATPMALPTAPATPLATPVLRAPATAAPVAPLTPPMAPSSPSAAPRVADVIAWVGFPPGAESQRMACTALTRAGAFLCSDGALPALRSRVSLMLELNDRLLPCTGEVVRHVLPAEAASWGMRAGFAIQFVNLSAELRDALDRLAHGHTPAPLKPAKTLPDDPRAEALLGALLHHMSSDPYALLSLPQDATFDDVRNHVRDIQRSVEAIAARPLSARQMRDLAEVRSRVERAADLLGQPRQRIEHDARHGNYPGVARCISSGLTATEIETLRARYLQAHPGAEMRGRMHATSAASWEAQGKIDPALTEYEKALSADPLNLPLQQRYWSLKRRDPRQGSGATPAPARLKTPSGRFASIPEPPSTR